MTTTHKNGSIVESVTGAKFMVVYSKKIYGTVVYKIKNIESGRETYPVDHLDLN